MSAPTPLDPALIARLFDESRGARWDLPRAAFEAALAASLAHAFADRPPTAADAERHLTSLHLEDLALATACAAGSERAWEHFITEYRPLLHRAADAIDPTGRARDLADSIHADLYGLQERGGARQSLFRYFHGRSRLATWLRAVLSQRHIDRLRAGRRLDPLPDDADALPAAAGIGGNGDARPNPERERYHAAMQRALRSAIAALAPRDRLRLSCYYAQDLTLLAIGRLLKEHESTVSRHLARTRTTIRESVAAELRSGHGMDDQAILECFRSVIDDVGDMNLADLVGPAADRKIAPLDRSRE